MDIDMYNVYYYLKYNTTLSDQLWLKVLYRYYNCHGTKSVDTISNNYNSMRGIIVIIDKLYNFRVYIKGSGPQEIS